MKNLLVPAVIFFTLQFSSCGSQEQKKEARAIATPANSETELEKGKLISKVSCNSDASLNYALYLPSGYSKEKQFPVMFFFDSHGDGTLPLKKYQELSETFGWIFIGSNNSKNGLQANETMNIVSNTMTDVLQKLSIDPSRIYLSGFSGGSRVAGAVALANTQIAGVVACSAGLPLPESNPKVPFYYAGIGGNMDVNLSEMKSTHTRLDRSQSENILFVFDGKHEWPPVPIMKDALLWLRMKEMRKGKVQKSDSLLQSLIHEKEIILTGLRKQNKIKERDDLLLEIINFADGLTDVSTYKKESVQLENTAEYKKAIITESKFSEEEVNKKNAYASALTTQPVDWWKQEIRRMKKDIPGQREEFLLNQRLLGYLGLIVYSYSAKTVHDNEFESAEKFLYLYIELEPNNPEAWYLSALMQAKKHNDEMVFSLLDKAVENGFNDLNRLNAESDFNPVRNTPKFVSITNKIH